VFLVGVAFVAFCLAASGIYALNDVVDRHADANHPRKCRRPVARGVVSPQAAVALAMGLVAVSGALALLFAGRPVALVIMLYVGLQLAYSLLLKEFILLDVIVIAVGFVLRAWAGSLAVGVPASPWLVACMFTLCLFMGFGKRRCELAMIGNADDAGRHRRTLLQYTPDLLNHLLTVSAGIAVMTFLLYTMDTSRPAPFSKERLFLTLPVVVYGVFRFALVSELGLYSGPTEIVLKDRPMLAAILIWATIALAIAYRAA
jgi:4-hydroxybenzoate polyprenyltransferase